MAEVHSPFFDIFMAIRQRLIDAASTSVYIDQDLGQLRNHTRPPVTWPCILIDFEDFKFESLGENVQAGKGTVVLQLGFAPYSNSTQVTPQEYIDKAMVYYDYELLLHSLLQGWSPTEASGHMARTSVTTQKRKDHYRVREMRYTIAFEDYFTRWQRQMAPAEVVLTEEIIVSI
jgi:hypothetical protein